MSTLHVISLFSQKRYIAAFAAHFVAEVVDLLRGRG